MSEFQKVSCRDRKKRDRCPVRLIQLSAVGEVFLEGTCPLSRRPQTAKFPVPMLLGTRSRWVRKATAFRGRSEQDRSALFPVCCADILKTFRWNVFNGIFLAAKTPDTARRVPTQCTEHLASCAQLEQLDEFHSSDSLRFCTMLFVISEYSMSCPYNFICQSPFPPHFSLFQANFAILETGEEFPQKGWLL